MRVSVFTRTHECPKSVLHNAEQLLDNGRWEVQMFTDVFQRENQLLSTDLRQGTLLATALLIRGNISISDASCNVERLGKLLPMPFWNPGAFKWGLCSVPPSGTPSSLYRSWNPCLPASLPAACRGCLVLYEFPRFNLPPCVM